MMCMCTLRVEEDGEGLRFFSFFRLRADFFFSTLQLSSLDPFLFYPLHHDSQISTQTPIYVCLPSTFLSSPFVSSFPRLVVVLSPSLLSLFSLSLSRRSVIGTLKSLRLISGMSSRVNRVLFNSKDSFLFMSLFRGRLLAVSLDSHRCLRLLRAISILKLRSKSGTIEEKEERKD